MENKTLIAYKGFDKDMKCRDFQYEVGKEYETAKAKACESGFHACENPLDVLDYYNDIECKYCIVEQSGNIDKEDRKQASTKIKIKTEIGFVGLFKAGIEWLKTVTKPCDMVEYNSGDSAQIGSSGDYAKIDSTGNDSVICCAGCNSIAKAKKGSWITLSEWEYSEEKQRNIPICVKTEYVDGERIKEDTWYKLINGKFTEYGKKINIAELLKDCPQGMELDCVMFENLEFDRIEDDNGEYNIICRVKTEFGDNVHTFTKYGCFTINSYAKCVIYPKGKNTWEGFQRPFKDGDIVAYVNPHRANLQVFIFKSKKENNTLSSCYLMLDGDELDLKEGMYYVTRFATEEEKQKLFDAIKANGYRWNAKTKTLEKLIEPKFKVGDRIKNKNSGICDKVIKIFEDCYLVESCLDEQATIDFDIQDNWELVPNKFDITTLKPFDKVLVRDSYKDMWCASIFSHTWKDKYFCIGAWYNQCIPYEANKELLGTTNDCGWFYKNWEEE